MSRLSHTTRPIWVTAVAACLLALHWWLGVTGWFGKSVTADETAHLVGGYSYWKFNDYRLQPENGNLPQRWAALPLLLENPRVTPSEDELIWKVSDVWGIGQKFFFESGNNSDFMLATARACMALWSVALGLMIFAWSRHLWGDLGGIFSLTLYTFSPTVLAHGFLVTSDITAAFFLIAAPTAFWAFLNRPTKKHLTLSVLCTGLATVAKFSFVVLGPVYAVMLVSHGYFQLRAGENLRGRWWLGMAGSITLHVVAAWATIWLFFGFRYSGFSPDLPSGLKYYYPWQELLNTQPGWKNCLTVLKEWKLLPEPYVHGFAYVLHAAQNRGAFLAGNYSTTGWWWFFPYAFLIKTPSAELLAYMLGGLLICQRWWAWGRERIHRATIAVKPVIPLLALFLVFWGVSVTSSLNIGHRHLLPIYPVLIIFAGMLLRPAAKAWLKGVAISLGCLAIVESSISRPHYLSYFNFTVGGSSNGWRHLVDSSLDWGQDLPDVASWLTTNQQPKETVYIAYFGMGDWRYEGIEASPLAPYYYHYRPRYWEELTGGLYCVSATMLQDPYSSWNGQWTARHETIYQFYLRTLRTEIKEGKNQGLIEEFGYGTSRSLWDLDRLRFARLCLYLRLRKPDAVIANTMFCFRLTTEEVITAVDGTPEKLASLMESAEKAGR